MTKNVDPNEAWLDEVLNSQYGFILGPESTNGPLKAAILAKLHEAGELERELVALPKSVPTVEKAIHAHFQFNPDGDEWWVGYLRLEDTSAYNGLYERADTPVAAVRALRKRLEEEGIC